MKLSTIIPTTLLLCTQVVKCYDYSHYDYILNEISALDFEDSLDYDDGFDFGKRADSNSFSSSTTNSAAVDQYVSLFKTIGASGLIPQLLSEIANSSEQVQNLANQVQFFAAGGSNISFDGLNVELNFTEILNAVLDSGIIQSTANGLLVNDTNNQFLAQFLGGVLSSPNNVWIGWLLMGLGNGHDLTVPWLADLIVNSTSKANTNSTNQSEINVQQQLPVAQQAQNYDVVIDFSDNWESNFIKRADDDTNQYSGSLNQFINNAANTILNSQLVSSNANDILVALNQSGIVVPLVIEVLKTPNLNNLVSPIVATLYNNGVFDGLDLESYYEYAKEKNYLSDALQYLLTDEHWSPPLAQLFRRMEDTGSFQYLQDNMYGPHKRKQMNQNTGS